MLPRARSRYPTREAGPAGGVAAHPGGPRPRSALELLEPRGPRFRHAVFADDLPRTPRFAKAFRPELARARRSGLSAADADFVRWLYARADLAADAYRVDTVERRLACCLRQLRVADGARARRLLAARPDLVDRALDTMLIGVSSFFRDPPVFTALREMMPVLAGGGRLGVWSVGCSHGAELYSTAMLLAEANLLDGSTLVGTDCRRAAIRRARAGVFEAEHLATLDPGLRRWLLPHGTRWQVAGRLRRATRWSVADALSGGAPGAWDVILCRNFGIYLDPAVAATLWCRLAGALRRGGVLVVGKTERPGPATGLVPVGPSLFRREGSLP
jgi:chemotaxis protein methyltransferase CheR